MHDRPKKSIVLVIAVAVAVFLLRPTAAGRHQMAERYGAIPVEISQATRAIVAGEVDAAVAGTMARLATAIFVHADFEHLLMNMVLFWPFATLVARHLGDVAMMVLVVVTGIAGNGVQVWLNVDSPLPVVGASGAVTGLEGVYFGLLLRWKLPDPDVWPLAHPVPPLQLGAFAVAGILYDAYSVMNHAQGIAYGAHLGGFIAGLAAAAIITTLHKPLAA